MLIKYLFLYITIIFSNFSLFAQCDTIFLEKIKHNEIEKILIEHKNNYHKTTMVAYFSCVVSDDFTYLYIYGKGNIYTIEIKTMKVIKKDVIPFNFIQGKIYPMLMYNNGCLGLAMADFRQFKSYKGADFDILLFDKKMELTFKKRYKTENYLEELKIFYTFSNISNKLHLISPQRVIAYNKGNNLLFYKELYCTANNKNGDLYTLNTGTMQLSINNKLFFDFDFAGSSIWFTYHNNHFFISNVYHINYKNYKEQTTPRFYDFNLITKELKLINKQVCTKYIPYDNGFYHIDLHNLRIIQSKY